MKQIRAAIKAIRSYLPPDILTNEQLARDYGEADPDSILAKTGIAIRHIAAPDECASDLGVIAARQMFESGLCNPGDVDFLLLCTQTPDYFLPTTACVMQSRLGLRTDCGAIDINQGCSGYVYGLALAKSLIESNLAGKVLLITADTYSKLINPRDRTIRTLFGDGATATLLSAVESEIELVGPFIFGTDGRGEKELIVPAGGMRWPVDEDARVEKDDGSGNWRSACDLHMNGGEVFNFTLRTIPPVMDQFLQKCKLSLDEIDYFIPHQANKFMLDRLRGKLKIPAEKFCIDLKESGNTVSSTIPIAFENAIKRGQVKSGQKVVLFGFGVGYSWGATLIHVV
jgi:3-oxoacyl-[acyl-carrier-protein] synthase-3